MKLLCKMGIALFIFMNFFYAMPQTVSAKASAESNLADSCKRVGIAETGLPEKENIQMIDEKENKQMPDTCYELKTGESIILGTTSDGGTITMSCVGTSMDLARAGKKTSTKTYNINHNMAGVETLVIVVQLECTWYPNGEAGYISNLRGTYTIKNKLWSCKWDEDNKSSTNYYHALWLDMTYLGSSYSRLFAASYDPFNSTLSFGTAP